MGDRMNEKIKIAVDVLGGDNAPKITLEGIKLFLRENKSAEIIAYGPRDLIENFIKKEKLQNITIKDSKEKLDMGVKDVAIFLRKEGNDIPLFKAMKESDNFDALVSAGPTQAVVAGSQLIVGRIKTIRKVALAPIMLNFDGVKKLVFDVGANPTILPEQLFELAKIGREYARELFDIENPSIGLLNIGKENGKGREFEKQMDNLLRESDLNYIGFIESEDALNGDVRIILTQGFEGNIFIKSMEAIYKGIKDVFKKTMKKSFVAKLGLLFLKGNILKKLGKASPKNIGGALVLGCKNIVVKAHGSSDGKTFKNAISLAYKLSKGKMMEKLNEKYN